MIRYIKITVVSLAIAVLGTALYGAEPTPADTARALELLNRKPVVVTPPLAMASVPDSWIELEREIEAERRRIAELERQKTENSLPPESQPTPREGVAAMVAALNPQPGKTLAVYGSGYDARLEIAAASRCPGLKVIGIEIDPALAESARKHVANAGLSGRVTILTGDAVTTDIQADYGLAYLWVDTLTALRPKITKLERFVSYMHPVPGLGGIRSPGDVFLYVKRTPPTPPPVQYARPAAAVWKGKTYTSRVCNRPGCTMCAAIQAQLNTPVPVRQPVTSAGHYKMVKQCTTDWRGRKTCQMVKVWVPE